MRTFISFLAVLLLCAGSSPAQTVGISYVTSMESKAASYSENLQKIDRLKAKIPELELQRDREIKKLSEELDILYRDRENLINDMKVGARCSECGTWKSDFEKRGVNFQQHLGEVRGRAIPATTGELEQARKKFNEKIALKKVQIQNLKNGYGQLGSLREEIKSLEEKNKSICTDITAESKKYETSVFNDAKQKHENWVGYLLGQAGNILIALDKITIYQKRALRYEKEFREESEKIKERVAEETASLEEEKKNSIAQLGQQKETEDARRREITDALKQKKNAVQEQLQAVEADRYGLTANDSLLQARHSELMERITAAEKELGTAEKEILSIVEELDARIKQLEDEIFTLQTELSEKQEEEIEKLKPQYDSKKKEARSQEIAAEAELSSARKAYNLKLQEYTKKNDDFINEIGLESNRMLAAGKKVECSVWNAIKGMVTTNWNKVLPCVKAIPVLAKPFSTNVFNAYCPDISVTTKLGSYKSFLSGLDAHDREAVRQSSNAGWLESVMK